VRRSRRVALSCLALVPVLGPLGSPWDCLLAQEPVAALRLDSKPGASLRICLKLEDETPFLGAVNLHVSRGEGRELPDELTDSNGEAMFEGITTGTYTVEASSPGFVAAHLDVPMQDEFGQKTVIVIMKAKPVESIAKTAPVEPQEQADITAQQQKLAMFSAGIKSMPGGKRDYWSAHELEESVPAVEDGVACPTQRVLKGVGQRMVELVSNLERFSATERVEHFSVAGEDIHGSPQRRKFNYVVTVSRNSTGTFMLEEYRDGQAGPDEFPAHVASLGLPGLALLFHPEVSSDFTFTCEGLGQWGGRAAWQIRFAQRADRPVRMRSYSVNGRTFYVHLEGRAWIDPGSYQVIRLETELAKPIPEIQLALEHIAIDYGLVQFRTQKVQIWLPRDAQLYVDRKNHRYYRKHSFSDYQVFNIDTSQNDQSPKQSYSFTNLSDRDIFGVLSVEPTAGVNREPVTLSFTVPARGRVFKIVGPGKDVDLPVNEIATAKFTHSGTNDELKVDVALGTETTLEVIPQM
jgi:hypothetical protein